MTMSSVRLLRDLSMATWAVLSTRALRAKAKENRKAFLTELVSIYEML